MADNTTDAIAAAYLKAQGRTQAEIAAILRVSQPQVSRLLKLAEGNYYETHTDFLKDRVSAEELAAVLQRVSAPQLTAKLAHSLGDKEGIRYPHVMVFPSGQGTPQERLARFGKSAAGYIREQLVGVRICAVSWGQTLDAVVTGLEASKVSVRTRDSTTFIPVCGERAGGDPLPTSATTLASRLSNLINGDPKCLSLALVPAFIPGDFDDAEERGVRKLIRHVEGYRRIFGEEGSTDAEPPLIDRVSMVLTSVGTSELPVTFGPRESFCVADIDIEKLSSLITGDIAGCFIGRPGLSREEEEKLRLVSDRWTGVRREHLLRCATEQGRGSGLSSRAKRPGVVVLAVGAAKAPMMLETARLGLSNIWVIDEEMQTALSRLLS
jgi:DNA-binding transcriptional regulator LsrR (DeoR family)